MLWQLRDPLEQALELIHQVLSSPINTNMTIHAESIAGLLSEQSETSSAAADDDNELPSSLIEIIEQYSIAEELPDAPTSLFRGYLDGLREQKDLVETRLHLAFDAVLQAADVTLQPDLRRNELVIAQALLMTIHEYVSAVTRHRGFQIWVNPGESIQAAIDHARDGATITIAPGVYSESLYIDKSIVLEGAGFVFLAGVSAGTRIGYSSTINPVARQIGILIHSEDSIEVTIGALAIQEASQAIAVTGNAIVKIVGINVLESNVGLDVSDSARVEISNSHLEYIQTAVRVSQQAELTFVGCGIGLNSIALELTGGMTTLKDCRVWGNSHSDSAVQVRGSAILQLVDSEVTHSEGSGIHASDNARLSISGGQVTYHDEDGILLSGRSTLVMEGVFCVDNGGFGVRAMTTECRVSGSVEYEEFSGQISGSENTIPD